MKYVDALALFKIIIGMKPGALRLALCVSGIESGVGNKCAAENNWGSVTAFGSVTPYWHGRKSEHKDSRYDPKTGQNVWYTTNFRAYDTPKDGLADLALLLGTKYSLACEAAARGDWRGAAAAMYDKGYYSGTKPRVGAINDYATGLEKHAKGFGFAGAEGGSGIRGGVLVGALVFAVAIGLGFGLSGLRESGRGSSGVGRS